jgi:hypothetical protein
MPFLWAERAINPEPILYIFVVQVINNNGIDISYPIVIGNS